MNIITIIFLIFFVLIIRLLNEYKTHCIEVTKNYTEANKIYEKMKIIQSEE
jgi:hypothetical protein